MSDVTSPRRFAQPHPRLGGVVKNLAAAYQTVYPIVTHPVVRVVTNGIQRGVKRGADSLLEARNRIFTSWVETRQSRDDGLIIKRFKRLPIVKKKSYNPEAPRQNALPVTYLKSLPNDSFRWTDDAYTYLGKENHAVIKRFIDDFINAMQANLHLHFDGIQHWIDPRTVPDEVSRQIRAYSRNERLSIIVHNHMIKELLANDNEFNFENRDKAAHKLWTDILTLKDVYAEIYEKEGRLAVHKHFGLKPYGPLEYPYEELGHQAIHQRSRLMNCLCLLQFLLSQRDAFNQMFPVETVGGIMADIDAIHKDEPAPSHVDWPGKNHRNCPGSFPGDVMDELLFETIPAQVFEPIRLWDHHHPSPSKHLTDNNYDSPHREAMRLNELYYDGDQVRAKRGRLRKENARPAKKKQARFIDSPVAWYKPSNNVPIQQRGSTLPSPSPSSPTSHRSPESPASLTSISPATPTKQTGLSLSDTHLTMAMEQVDRTTKKASQAPLDSNDRQIVGKIRPQKYKDIDDFFANDHLNVFGKGFSLRISKEKADDFEIREQLEQDAKVRAEHEIKRIARERRRLEEEVRLKAEQEHLRVQEELLLAEQRRQEEEDRKLTDKGELRAAHRAIIPSMSTQWIEKAEQAVHARSNAELAKSPDGTVLQKKDFETVVKQNQWLNDEIINATLLHLGNYVNQKVGIKNTRVCTPKIQIFNSFVGKNLDDGRPPTERMLRRAGIRKDNFLDIETILIPICRGAHWTLVAVRPKYRQIYHLDSLNSRGNPALIAKVHTWIKGVLGENYNEHEWKIEVLASPRQSNMDDCGVHTITNGICLALGVGPSSYGASIMPQQRLHVAAVLLNGGFEGVFTLDGI